MHDFDQAPLISADSHVVEDVYLWERELPADLKPLAPLFPAPTENGDGFQAHSGGWDPTVRVEEAAVDGVNQEILYPSWTLTLFGLQDVRLQQECFRIYNDWLINYCAVAPKNLFGVAAISTYDIDHAVAELERCKNAGHIGAMIWEIPPPELPFTSKHYEPFWDAVEQLEMPLSLHHFTGEVIQERGKQLDRRSNRGSRKARDLVSQAHRVNDHTFQSATALSDFLTSGILVRHPNLKVVLVENEISWIPFLLAQYDRFFEKGHLESSLAMRPSDYFERNFRATFFNDPPLGSLLETWGVNNCMWSNDFPHENSTWPQSAEVIKRDLGALSEFARDRLTRGNVKELYQLPKVGD